MEEKKGFILINCRSGSKYETKIEKEINVETFFLNVQKGTSLDQDKVSLL
jgi:hypothetical protein